MFRVHIVMTLLVTLTALPFSTATIHHTNADFRWIKKNIEKCQTAFNSHGTRTDTLTQQENVLLEDMLQGINNGITKLCSRLQDMKFHFNKEVDSLQNKEQANVDSTKTITDAVQTLSSDFTEVVRNELAKLIPVCDDRLMYKETDEKIALVERSLEKMENSATLRLNHIKNEINNLKNSTTKEAIRSACRDGEKNLFDNKVLTKLEGKLKQHKVYQVPDFGSILAGEDCRSRFSNETESHNEILKSTGNSISSIMDVRLNLVRQYDFIVFTNRTLDAVQAFNTKNAEKIGSQLYELATQLNNLQNLLLSTSTESNKKRIKMYDDLSGRNQQILTEVEEFSSTLLRFENIIKPQVGDMYITLKKRFEEMKSSITEKLAEQDLTLSSLGSTVKTEMSEVWQHLAVFKQLLAKSKTALDTLYDRKLCQ